MNKLKVFLTSILLLYTPIKPAKLASTATDTIIESPNKLDSRISFLKETRSLGRKRSLFLLRDKLDGKFYSPKVVVNSGQMNVLYQPFNIRGGGADLEPNYFKPKIPLEGNQSIPPTFSDYTWLFAKAVIERGFSSLIYMTNSASEVLGLAKDYTSVLLESGLEKQREKLLLEHSKALIDAETKALAKIAQAKEREAKMNRFGNFIREIWKTFNEGRAKRESVPLPVEKPETHKTEWTFPRVTFWSTPKSDDKGNVGILQHFLNMALLFIKFTK